YRPPSLLPCPPRSTLFPYTTLFRSNHQLRIEHQRPRNADALPLPARKRMRIPPHCFSRNAHLGERPDHPVLQLPSLADLVDAQRSEEHTSELQSRENLVCRLLLEKK